LKFKIPFFTEKRSESELKLIRFMIDKFGYRPTNLTFFKQAVTHSSISHGRDSNERLEFLGDSLLDSILAEYLYAHFPNENEGFLTKNKSNIVSRKALSQLAESLELRTILNFKEHANLNLQTLEGNALEAIIGAIFLDSNYETLKKCLHYRVFRNRFSLDKMIHIDHDFKSRLTIWCQKRKMKLEFVLSNDVIIEGVQTYEIEAVINGIPYGKGRGNSKKNAEQQAAEQALDYFEIS
jgi:ribonuclease-3